MAAKKYKLKSSNLKSMTYDSKAKDLHVTFKNGSTYRYTAVPAHIVRAIRKNKSAGKTFNKRIKGGGFEYTKVAFIRGFLDELTKVAAAPEPQRMRKIMQRLDPRWPEFWSKDRPRQVREYRDLLASREPIPASLSQRVKSYKHWKRTGEVPAVSLRRGKVREIHTAPEDVQARHGIHRPMKYTRSSEPVDVVHYGVGDVRAATHPVRPVDRHYIVPGEQFVEAAGTYFGKPGVEFPGYGQKKLTATVPRRALLETPARYGRPEAILPRSQGRRVIRTKVEEKK